MGDDSPNHLHLASASASASSAKSKFQPIAVTKSHACPWESHGKRPIGWDSTHLYFP